MSTQHPVGDAPCAQIRALLAGLGDDEPAPDMLAALASHLTGCATCGEAEATLAALIARYRVQDAPVVPLRLEQRIIDQICGAG